MPQRHVRPGGPANRPIVIALAQRSCETCGSLRKPSGAMIAPAFGTRGVVVALGTGIRERCGVRLAGWLLFVLVILGWALSEIPVARTPANEPSAPTWRRTSDGWQRQNAWTVPPPRSPRLHPTILGTLQVLVSVGALIALPHGRRTARRQALPQKHGHSRPAPLARRATGNYSASR